jgi:hypothetical protein
MFASLAEFAHAFSGLEGNLTPRIRIFNTDPGSDPEYGSGFGSRSSVNTDPFRIRLSVLLHFYDLPLPISSFRDKLESN